MDATWWKSTFRKWKKYKETSLLTNVLSYHALADSPCLRMEWNDPIIWHMETRVSYLSLRSWWLTLTNELAVAISELGERFLPKAKHTFFAFNSSFPFGWDSDVGVLPFIFVALQFSRNSFDRHCLKANLILVSRGVCESCKKKGLIFEVEALLFTITIFVFQFLSLGTFKNCDDWSMKYVPFKQARPLQQTLESYFYFFETTDVIKRMCHSPNSNKR